jgi:hypothetical protein
MLNLLVDAGNHPADRSQRAGGPCRHAFYDLVKNNWQPILAQASLFTAIVGFYVPGVLYIDPKSTWIS